MDRGVLGATIHGVVKSQTWLSDWTAVAVKVIIFSVKGYIVWVRKILFFLVPENLEFSPQMAHFSLLTAILCESCSSCWCFPLSLITGFPQRQNLCWPTGVRPGGGGDHLSCGQVSVQPAGHHLLLVGKILLLSILLKWKEPLPNLTDLKDFTILSGPPGSSGKQRGISLFSYKPLLSFLPRSLHLYKFSPWFIPITFWCSLQGFLMKAPRSCPD